NPCSVEVYDMRFGYYDDVRREYVITTPLTPRPWINYLGCEDFFSIVSNVAGGYCFYRDARLRRILRHRYNSLPPHTGGRRLYIREGEHVWSPTFMPAKTELDRFECRHGLGYSTITGEHDGLVAELLLFVPLGYTAEIHRLTFENTSERVRFFSVFSFV